MFDYIPESEPNKSCKTKPGVEAAINDCTSLKKSFCYCLVFSTENLISVTKDEIQQIESRMKKSILI